MAQTQKYEKVIIMDSSSDEDYFNNTPTSFTNRIFPINSDQTYDSIIPMSISVPMYTSQDQTRYVLKKSLLDRLGVVNDYWKKFKVVCRGTYESTKTIDVELDVNYTYKIESPIDLSGSFSDKPDLAKLLTFKFLFKVPLLTHEELDNDMKLSSNIWTPNDPRVGFILFSTNKIKWNLTIFGDLQTLTIVIEDEENYRILIDLYCYFIPDELTRRYPGELGLTPDDWWKDKNYWPKERIDMEFNRIGDFNQKTFRMVVKEMKMVVVGDPFDEIPPQSSEPVIDDDNQQIYVHCDQITNSRIANQNEQIFQDVYLSQITKNKRFLDNVSLPMYLPINLQNNLVEQLTFHLYNAVGEENKIVDRKAPTYILCKLIKKYYDFSDGKKKTNITNLHTI